MLHVVDAPAGALLSMAENGTRYQLESHGRRLDNLERKTENINVIAAKLDALDKDVEKLGADVRGFRNAFIGATITFAMVAVGALITLVTQF